MHKILLVEDDGRLAHVIDDYLSQQGFDVAIEGNGDRAVKRILLERPDLVILDLMLPGLDGLSICRIVRSDFKGPIMMLTAKEDDADQVAGLELGADDYVNKPVAPRVLLARINMLMRRFRIAPDTDSSGLVTHGSLQIDPQDRRVTLEGNEIDLTTTEFDLLLLMASTEGEVLDRDTIYQSLRGIEYDGFDRSVDACVSRLRKKLGDDPEHPARIKTVWGRGYLFAKQGW